MKCLTYAAGRVFARNDDRRPTTRDGHAILPAGDCACGSLLGDYDVRFCDLCGAEGCSRCHVKNDIGETGWMCRACADDQVGGPHPRPLSRHDGRGVASDARRGEGICDGCLVPGGCGCRAARGETSAEARP